jgi:hypothetical protein
MPRKAPPNGLSLETNTSAQRKKFVHHTCEEFEITSDTPISDIVTCELLNLKLGGDMGCFFYPKDAVIHFFGTTDQKEMLDAAMKEWDKKCREDTSCPRSHHFSVESTPLPNVNGEEEEDDEDDDYNESDDEEEEDAAVGEDDKEEWPSDDELPEEDSRPS